MEAKGFVAELTLPHAQSTWGFRGKRVQTVRLAAYYNYFSKKKKMEKCFVHTIFTTNFKCQVVTDYYQFTTIS